MNSLISLDLDFNELGDNLEAGKLRGLNTLQALHLRHNSDLSDIREYTNCFKKCGVRGIKVNSDKSFRQPSSFQTKSPATLTFNILRTPHLFL